MYDGSIKKVVGWYVERVVGWSLEVGRVGLVWKEGLRLWCFFLLGFRKCFVFFGIFK